MAESTFSKDNLTLKTLVSALRGKDVQELKRFVQKYFGNPIGQGAYRTVWKVKLTDRIVVLKIANTEDATWSNGKEIKVFGKCKKLSIISKIIAHDRTKSKRWIVSEFVPNPADDKRVMKYFGITRKVWNEEIYSFNGDIMYSFLHDSLEYKDNAWYKELAELKHKGKVVDLHNANWRANSENMPVLVDYGCGDL